MSKIRGQGPSAATALGWAKTDRQRWVLFDPVRAQHDVARHQLTAQMPTALASGEFILVYQPMNRLSDNTAFGVEALARWEHPTHGVLSPAAFIPLAEQTGLIDQLTWHLLHLACTQATAWRRHPNPPVMSVNVAPTLLAQPGLASTIARILDQTQLPPELLQLEITESAPLADHDHSLTDLDRLGVRLAIDDFGTGYSSLAHLNDLPVTTVKLAGRFLHRLHPHDPSARSAVTILTNVIKMSHDMGISVIAEEIETADQARHLTELGCDIGQGYHLGKPTTGNHITATLRM